MESHMDRFFTFMALAALLAIVEAPDPCCLRVTPYHIQALAQRMAQRFQALEFRAQDLRGVFASFQAVHGNASHRLKNLEAEHAHLSEIVSRLDSRLQLLEADKRMEEYRRRIGYYRGERYVRAPSNNVRTAENDDRGGGHRNGFQRSYFPPFYRSMGKVNGAQRTNAEYELFHYINGTHQRRDTMNNANRAHATRKRISEYRLRGKMALQKIPHSSYKKTSRSEIRSYISFPYARYRRNDVSAVLPPLRVHLNQPEEPVAEVTSNETLSSATIDSAAPISSPPFNEYPPVLGIEKEPNKSESLPPQEMAPEPTISSTGDLPAFVGMEALNESAIMASGTTPTPLWQLEESADALLQAMSAGDEDDTNALPSVPEDYDSVSYWSPANETDSLEQLFDHVTYTNAIEPTNCAGKANCAAGTEGSLPSPTNATVVDIVNKVTSLVPDSNLIHTTDDNIDSSSTLRSSVYNPNETMPNLTGVEDTIHANKTVNTKTGCQESSLQNPDGATLAPANDSLSLSDIFSSGASGLDDDSTGATGNGNTCEGAGCDASQHELSDAELQEALRELDALLQRPPASAPPPDPEKLLLKRALKLALAALERTSDACLTLVNFTADAFEGLAAAEVAAAAEGSVMAEEGVMTTTGRLGAAEGLVSGTMSAMALPSVLGSTTAAVPVTEDALASAA